MIQHWPIPSQWKWARMGDVADIVGGGTPKSDNIDYFGGDVPWITPADLSGYTDKFISSGRRNITRRGLQNSGAKLLPAGTVLFSSRAPIGYVAIAANPVSTNQGFKSFVLRNGLTSEFVYYYLQFAKKFAIEMASGTTFLEISGKKAAEIPVVIPPPKEQRRIVAEIEKQFTRLDAGIAALRNVQTKLKRYRAAVLKAACEGRLVPTEAEFANGKKRGFESGEELLLEILAERRGGWSGKGKYKEPLFPSATSRIPRGWTIATLDQICPVFVDSAHRTPKYGAEGSPALGPRDVVGGRLDLENARLVNESEFAIQTARRVPESGDIVYSRELSLGWGALVPEGRKICLSQGMCLFRPHNRVDPRYFLHLLNGPVGRKHAEDAATGSAHPHLNLSDIKAYEFPLPPLAEQKRIVAEV
jgi:type I restriction enzyme S subunit